MSPDRSWLGSTVQAIVEVPAWTFVKFRSDGSVDFVSPLPSPWNYGRVPGEMGGDGDPLDVILWGRRLPRDAERTCVIQGQVDFVDNGAPDLKLIAAPAPLGLLGRVGVVLFFRLYGPAKALRYRLKGERRGRTWLRGVRFLPR